MNTAKSIIYAFIDSQNLNLGVQASGWKLDFGKFRLYLKNKYHVERAYLFIGQVEGNESLYSDLQEMGYILVFKPATQYMASGKLTVKGNVDAELVLYAAAKLYNKYDEAIIVTGDGDFFCLVEYLEEKGKLLHLMTPNGRYSKLLKKYSSYIVIVGRLKKSLAQTKKDQHGRSVETLGLSGHGDKQNITKKHTKSQ